MKRKWISLEEAKELYPPKVHDLQELSAESRAEYCRVLGIIQDAMVFNVMAGIGDEMNTTWLTVEDCRKLFPPGADFHPKIHPCKKCGGKMKVALSAPSLVYELSCSKCGYSYRPIDV
jgi:hypothetical protein